MPRLSSRVLDEEPRLRLVVNNVKMTHARLQNLIIGEAGSLLLHVHHCDMRQSEPGFPDLVIVGPHGVLWRELKVPPDELSSEQRALGYTLIAARQNWKVWTPDDLVQGDVRLELESIAR